MNIFAVLCCYILLPYSILATRPPKRNTEKAHAEHRGSVTGLKFFQKLDHFHSNITDEWKQQYYMNASFYQKNGPLFLVVGGQEAMKVSTCKSGAWIQYAQNAKAMLICVEHRYYGNSRPTDDLSTENLVHLNTEQVLADLAYFIDGFHRINENIPEKSKWIAFGAAEGGTLAARLRMKFPHLILGAITSSAPIKKKINFKEYFETVEYEFGKYGRVKEQLREAYAMIYKALEDNEKPKIEEMFKLCSPLDKNSGRKNVQVLFWTISNLLGLVVQYGSFELKFVKDNVIIALDDSSKPDALSRLAHAIGLILSFKKISCIAVDYEAAVNEYRKTSWDDDGKISFSLANGFGNRQNLFQRCTEFGQFETSDQESQIFGHDFPLEFFVEFCAAVFGNQITPTSVAVAVDKTDFTYGGVEMEVSRVLFVNGTDDPWIKVGITETRTNDLIAVCIQGASHCDDVNDKIPLLSDIRNEIMGLLFRWLQ